MPGLHLAVCLADFSKHSLLICYVRFDRVRDEEIRASPGGFCEPGQALLYFWLEPNAQRRTSCVRHEHILARHVRGGLPKNTKAPIVSWGFDQQLGYRTLPLTLLA
jgi:hypothetical protein